MKSKLQPYFNLMRMHQPSGFFLLLWPCLISLNIANNGHLDPKLTIIFILGSILMRSAGCIINDLVDYNIDDKVDRTKDRPIANGKITFFQAFKLLFLLLLVAASLLFFLNQKAIMISLFSIIMIIIYPFCKRFTYLPQLFLGLTFNMGVLIAWVTVQNSITLPVILLYIGCVFWTLGYDTIYAHQDIKDDLLLGLKSTAIKFGEKTGRYLNFFYTIAVTMIIVSGNLSKVGHYYNVFLVLPIMLFFWQIKTLDITNPNNCAKRFKINVLIGGLIFLATLFTRDSLWQ